LFEFKRATVLSLEQRVSKHKTTRYARTWWGMAPLVPLTTPMVDYSQLLQAVWRFDNSDQHRLDIQIWWN